MLKPSKCCDSYDGMVPTNQCHGVLRRSVFLDLFRHSIAELRTRGNIYELGKVHLLALQSDAKLLTETFNELQRSVRPKLRRETPRRDDEEEGAACDGGRYP